MRYRSRAEQIGIFLGKFLRMFIYQNDWKVLPMSALIAGLLAYVIRTDFMRNMEGTLKGAFAISCVALWNGCFNSIQVICRERDIIKREHRSGMHISSYIIAHMIYQAMLCMAQTILTMYVFRIVGMKMPAEGFITNWFRADLSVTIFLITFSADMLALLISSIVRSTTGAMTVMPFILIFQLVFSGGFFDLPSWTSPLTALTLSRYGLTCINAQCDYNSLPMATAWRTLRKMKDTRIEGTVTLGEAMGLLDEEAGEKVEAIGALRSMEAVDGITLGEVIDRMEQDPRLEEARNKSYEGSVTIGEIISLFGEDEVREAVSSQASLAAQDKKYEKTFPNILQCWLVLGGYAFLYAFLAMVSLEFVDKDKR